MPLALATLTLNTTDTCLLPDAAAGNTQYLAIKHDAALLHGCGGNLSTQNGSH